MRENDRFGVMRKHAARARFPRFGRRGTSARTGASKTLGRQMVAEMIAVCRCGSRRARDATLYPSARPADYRPPRARPAQPSSHRCDHRRRGRKGKQHRRLRHGSTRPGAGSGARRTRSGPGCRPRLRNRAEAPLELAQLARAPESVAAPPSGQLAHDRERDPTAVGIRPESLRPQSLSEATARVSSLTLSAGKALGDLAGPCPSSHAHFPVRLHQGSAGGLESANSAAASPRGPRRCAAGCRSGPACGIGSPGASSSTREGRCMRSAAASSRARSRQRRRLHRRRGSRAAARFGISRGTAARRSRPRSRERSRSGLPVEGAHHHRVGQDTTPLRSPAPRAGASIARRRERRRQARLRPSGRARPGDRSSRNRLRPRSRCTKGASSTSRQTGPGRPIDARQLDVRVLGRCRRDRGSASRSPAAPPGVQAPR